MSHNFGFLAAYDAALHKEAASSERCFTELLACDLAVAGFRRFVERLTLVGLTRAGRPPKLPNEGLREQMGRLEATGRVPEHVAGWFAEARRLGNKGSHVGSGSCSSWEVVEMMRLARKLATWWLEAFYGVEDLKIPGFKVPQTGDAARDAHNQALAVSQEAREAALSEAARAEEARRARRARLVVHGGLTAAYSALGGDEQAAVAKAIEALRVDAHDPAWAHVPIAGAEDDKLRAVAVTDGVSLVTAVTAGGDVVFVLWASAPGEVAGWARHKRVEVHPVIGTVQLYDIEHAEAAVGEGGDDDGAPALFAAFGDEELVRVGVPVALLAAVREVRDEAGLRRLAPELPGEAGDALELLLVADSVDEVVDALGLAPAEVDGDDFEVAIEHPGTKRTFRMLADDEDLEAALSGSIAAWRLFLHPDQRALVRMRASGPVRVLGGAGTGKTVALIHRAAYLLEEVVLEGEVLVTTYTRNLATDLERALTELVDGAAMRRARVLNLHRLARQIGQVGPLAGTELMQAESEARLWSGAMTYESLGLPKDFYAREWREVVQPAGVADQAAYEAVTRRGRGVPLNRRQRRAVWQVLETFARLKGERRLVEWVDLVRHARQRIEDGAWRSPFRAVLADEVQDFGVEDLRLLRALVAPGPDDLFLVGDAHQRIYGTRTSLKQCGVAVQGRSRRLRVNYRTTEEIRDFAVGVIVGQTFDDLDGGTDTLAGYRSLRSGLSPRVVEAGDEQAEVDAIAEVLAGWLGRYPAEALCVAARTGRLVDRYREALAARGLQLVRISQEEPAGLGVRIATMHRLKGLEFSCVLIAGAREGVLPALGGADPGDDPVARAARELSERALLYVAATRARDELVLTTGGPRSPWLA